MTPRKRAALTIATTVAGYAALLVALFWPVFGGGQMSGWDCVVEYWPDLVFQIHALGDGEWPLWNPHVLGGYPALADLQAGMFAPVNWLLWILSLPFGDGAWLIQAKVLLNLLVGLCGMHAWMWHRRRSHVAAVVAALVFVLGSPLLVHKNGALLWPMLYLPWALLALERLAAHPSPRRGAALAATVWLMGTAGHPQSFFYGLVVLTLYGTFLVFATPSPRQVGTLLRRAWPGLLLAFVLVGLLLAATWVPAQQAVDASPRAHRGLGYVLGTAMTKPQLRELLAPGLDTNWQTDVYVGALPLVGGVWLLLAMRRARDRAEAAFWCLLGALGLALALGRAGHLLPWFAEHVPGFDLFRIALRLKLIFGVAAAVLAGDAAAALLARERAGWTRWAWLGLVAAWLALTAWQTATVPRWTLAALVVAGVPAWLIGTGVAARGARRCAALALPALVLADLWSAGAFKLAILQRRPDPARHASAVAAMAGADSAWRYHVGNMSSPYGGTVPYHVAFLADLREWSGYINPIEPQRHVELDKRARKAPGLLRHFNVRYFAGHRQPPAGARVVAPGIVEVDDVAPVARWYGGLELLSAPQLLDRLATAAPSELVAALAEPGDVAAVPPLAGADVAPVDGRVLARHRNTLTIAIDAPGPGVVVINEAFAPGWEARWIGDDGQRRDLAVVRAHYHLRAVVVPGGSGRIVMSYRPRGMVALVLGFFVGLAALALIGLGRWRWLDAVGGRTP